MSLTTLLDSAFNLIKLHDCFLQGCDTVTFTHLFTDRQTIKHLEK